MHLDTIKIQNFKGIRSCREFQLKPITLFIGPNSSGKSSVIHALAALSQTFKLPNNTRPIVLDDELADVHLGRFIEVIHSRSYGEAIGLEFTISGLKIPNFEAKKNEFKELSVTVALQFRSTLRTQDVYLDTACYYLDGHEFKITKSKKGYHLTFDGKNVERLVRVNGIFLDDISLLQAKDEGTRASYFALFFAQQQISERFKKIRYLGPFRQSPRRRYPTRGANPIEVGPEGEATITMLANEVVQHQMRNHITEISQWMNFMGIGKKIEIQRLARSDLFDAGIQLEDGEKFPIADLGYGISQILPVLAQCSFASAGDILLFEQPELHLHTASANQLASVLVEAGKKKGLRIIAETHSPDFFKRFITEMREGRLSRDDFAAYRVSRENKESCFTRLDVEDDGEVYTNWEKGLSIQ